MLLIGAVASQLGTGRSAGPVEKGPVAFVSQPDVEVGGGSVPPRPQRSSPSAEQLAPMADMALAEAPVSGVEFKRPDLVSLREVPPLPVKMQGRAHTQKATAVRSQQAYRAYETIRQTSTEGARLPAALMDRSGKKLSPQQEVVLQQMEEEFVAAIGEVELPQETGEAAADTATAGAKAHLREVWEKARARADNRFRLFFGEDAFNAMSLQSAQDAVAERR